MLRLIACSLALASTGTVVTALSSASSNRRAFIQTSGAAAAAAVVGAVLPANAVSQANVPAVGGKPIYGKEDIMSPKSHGTSDAPVQSELLYGVSNNLADRITNYNRRFAEQAGYFVSTSLEDTIRNHVEKTGGQPLAFYDSVTGKPLFVAPVGRSVDQFLEESKIHGWPSFRDQEVVWDNVRILKDGETVSLSGTHLGHNLPDRAGNRYCINLVSIAGQPNA